MTLPYHFVVNFIYTEHLEVVAITEQQKAKSRHASSCCLTLSTAITILASPA